MTRSVLATTRDVFEFLMFHKRKPGGQKRHPKHARPAFPPESINETWEYTLESCPLCGGGLEHADHDPRVVQQVEIIDVPIRIEAHRGRA